MVIYKEFSLKENTEGISLAQWSGLCTFNAEGEGLKKKNWLSLTQDIHFPKQSESCPQNLIIFFLWLVQLNIYF